MDEQFSVFSGLELVPQLSAALRSNTSLEITPTMIAILLGFSLTMLLS